jgi:hypothetical protein
MRLDTNLLPKPFQLSALTSRELTLESPWKRFVFQVTGAEPREAKDGRDAREAKDGREADGR